MARRRLDLRIALVVIAAFVAAALTGVRAGQVTTGSVAIDDDDIGGVVTGPRGPEAGVWVIAETTSLPTRLIKSVVTDDQGRYLVPDLPKATYDVWVRGYGLVDSPKVKAAPGKALNLTAVPAPNAKAAADYYPAQYWLSLLQLPPKSDFPGTGADRQRHLAKHQEPGRVDSQHRQHRRLHGLSPDGQSKATREIPEAPRQIRVFGRPPGIGGFSPDKPAAA